MKKAASGAGSVRYVPAADWAAVGLRGHGVQFYASDNHLIDLLARYIGTALVTGEVGIIIATDEHRQALERRLKTFGLDVGIARGQGRYITFDARVTLKKLMRSSWLDEDQVRKVFGGLLERVATAADGRPQRIYIFGEMVALLCAEARPDAAIRLEELWNEMLEAQPFSVCCAYPMNGFTEGYAAPFMRICAQHSHVFPASGMTRAMSGHATGSQA